jgi:hypothetical protein
MMEKVISQLSIQGFKSFGPGVSTRCSALNLLVGGERKREVKFSISASIHPDSYRDDGSGDCGGEEQWW